MCAFSKEGNFQIGKVLQFCHYEKKKLSDYQYQGRFAHTQQKDLGVLCTWFEETEAGTYKMCRTEHHCYIPLEKYICTLPRQCFVLNETFQPNHTASFQKFTLTTKCKQFILHSIGTGMQTCGSQPLTHKPESLQSTQQTVPSVKTIIDDTPKHQNIPKWFTVNYINLYQSDKDALTGNGWLNDQHVCCSNLHQAAVSSHSWFDIALTNPLPKY